MKSELTLFLTIFFCFCFSSALFLDELCDCRVDVKVGVPENVLDLTFCKAVGYGRADHFESLSVCFHHSIVILWRKVVVRILIIVVVFSQFLVEI